MKKTLVLCCALALASLSNVALAAEGGAGFIRAEVGTSDVEMDVDGLGSGSDDDSAYSVRGGYFFNANFGVEAFYSNLYDKSEDGASLELTGYGIGVVAKKNFGANNSGFFINGRAGIAHLKGEAGLAGFGSDSDTSNKAYVGVGAGYDFSESFGVSLNYDFHQADFDGLSVDADTLTVGGEFRF